MNLYLTSNKISDKFYLSKVKFSGNEEKKDVRNPIHHVFACDISYSMYSALSLMRTQLKNKIVDIVAPEDLITIIAFSGRNECTTIKSGVSVKNLQDITKLNEAIDRFLKPTGCTAFYPPIQHTKELINQYEKDGRLFSFIFLSDGYNNDSKWDDVVNGLEEISDKITSASMIEYGYYADSDKMNQMAEILGGQKVFCEDFDDYETQFESIIKNGNTSKRIEVEIPFKKDLAYQLAFSIDTERKIINTYSLEKKNTVLIPENVSELYFVSKPSIKNISDSDKELTLNEVLASAYVLATRLKYDVVEDIISRTNSVNLMNMLEGAYGKQRLNAFTSFVFESVFDNSLHYVEGKSKTTPKPRYTVFELVQELMSNDINKIYPHSPAWSYNRIGRKTETKVQLSKQDIEDLSNIKSVAQMQARLQQVEKPEFAVNDLSVGYSLKDLVWNSERANLSIRFRFDGKVLLPKNAWGITEWSTFIYRSFTIIKDGLLNMTSIPVSLTTQTYDNIKKFVNISEIIPDKSAQGYYLNELFEFDENKVYLVDFSMLPVVTKKMCDAVTIKKMTDDSIELLHVQCMQKVLKEKIEELGISKDELYTKSTSGGQIYPQEVYDYIKEIGITSYSGFSPKVDEIKTGDVYYSPALLTKISGFSSLPSSKKIDEKLSQNKKLTPSESLVNYYRESLNEYVKELSKDEISTSLLISEKQLQKSRLDLLEEIAKQKFSIILSRGWFKDVTPEVNGVEREAKIKLNENSYFEFSDKPLSITYEFKEEEIKL